MLTGLFGAGMIAIGIAQAQKPPMITGGPVNAASYISAGLPGAGTAQGSMFILFGQGLGPLLQANASSFPLPTNLADTSIRIKVGATTVDAIMLYTGSSQVAAILPSKAPIGDGTLSLTFGNQTSNTVPIHVVASSFGTFTRNSAGSGPGILFNFNTQTDQPVNSLVVAAHPGQVLTLWGTGLGPVSGNEAAGPLAGNLDVPVDVYVGNTRVDATYKGRSGCCAGIDQIVFAVPSGVAGCYVSVGVRAGGVTSNIATIAITPSGAVCSDPGGFSVTDLQKLQGITNVSVGEVVLNRISVKLSAPGLGTLQGNVDQVNTNFRRFSSVDTLAAQLGSVGGLDGLPSLGSCTASQFPFASLFDAFLLGGRDPVPSLSLDAGSALNLNGPRGAKPILRQGVAKAYSYGPTTMLGGGVPGILDSGAPEYLVPGDYTVDNGGGGADVGAFRATLTIPASPLNWTNQDALNNISRTQDLTITWSGGAPGGTVAIFGAAADPTQAIGAEFICAAPTEAGSFTVPAYVVSELPASGLAAGLPVKVPVGFLSIATTLPQPTRFQPTGIDVGFFNWGLVLTKNVNFQ